MPQTLASEQMTWRATRVRRCCKLMAPTAGFAASTPCELMPAHSPRPQLVTAACYPTPQVP